MHRSADGGFRDTFSKGQQKETCKAVAWSVSGLSNKLGGMFGKLPEKMGGYRFGLVLRMGIHTCMHTCMHAYMHTCIHACMHQSIHTYHTYHAYHTYHTYHAYHTYHTYHNIHTIHYNTIQYRTIPSCCKFWTTQAQNSLPKQAVINSPQRKQNNRGLFTRN